MHNLWLNSKGSLRLAVFFLRRDWLNIVAWMVGLLIFATAVPMAIHSIYGADGQTLQAMVPMLQNPAMIALVGPVFDATNYTVGSLIAGEMLLFTVLAVAFMNILFVVRYTRADEEAERVEVIRSLPVGRLAPLNAALIGALKINFLVIIITWAGLVIINIPTVTVKGSFLYAAACGVIGMVFAGVAAVCAQLASTSRSALAYSGGILGVLYLLRAAGDLLMAQGDSWAKVLSYASPFGLVLRVEAYVTNQFWPLPYLLVQVVVLIGIAYFLNSHRDLGAGLIPAKPGPAHAGPLLDSNLGLALRLLRNTLIAWLYVAIVLGASYGSIMNYIADFIKTSTFFQAALQTTQGYSTTEAFASLIMVVLAAMTAAGPIMIALKAWREEEAGRTELVLAASVSRRSYLASYGGIALVLATVLPLLAAAGLWGASAIVMKSDPISASFFFKSMAVYLPAIWLFVGATLLLIAVYPRIASGVIWGYFAFSFFMGYFGELFPKIPQWIPKLSPFGLVPNITKDAIHWPTLAIMTGIAVVMIVAAFVLYRKRDLSN
ncbi:MAG: ABC transporter permease [Coriobacteriia bacterium]|nr:ABC transporter permease [Coriobacteriia bacterium]MCL2745945.1 ABC transporter permease [Coriobacteriia bacterium]MCL2871335.1 ABC transporter permease [Coriobacteriia bacterium]